MQPHHGGGAAQSVFEVCSRLNTETDWKKAGSVVQRWEQFIRNRPPTLDRQCLISGLPLVGDGQNEVAILFNAAHDVM
jgi:hypothetical protein